MSVAAMQPYEFRLLIIDDNVAIHRDFQKILAAESQEEAHLSQVESLLFGDNVASAPQGPSYLLDYASQGQQGAELVTRAAEAGWQYALAFVDMRMPPGWDGLETIEHLWAVDPDIQIVICSAHSDYEWADVVARLGHTDKLLVLKKPFEPIEVKQCASALTRKWLQERALRSQVVTLEEAISARTESLEKANRQLRHLATHDVLTGLPNRVLLDDRIAQAIVHSQRESQSFALLVLDLDRFKPINDSLGHRAGDLVLGEVSRRLSTVVRDIDTVARFGGDEFVLVISPASRAEVEEIARRANEVLQRPLRIAGVDLHMSSSIGIAFYPQDGTTAESLIARADAAMYCAKDRGRSNFQCFSAGMDSASRDRAGLESDLRQALRQQQFELFYQAKADVASGDINSAEALIRWQHPQRGLILPGEFIPLAEESGLICELGAWVLEQACRQCKAWQREGLPALRVAVNVSAQQFRQGDLLEVVGAALRQAALEPHWLEVELTESAVMINPEESAAILERLSAMGVLVSVDDFGTGYSSMSYLRRFPIDKLKIDRSFVQDLVTVSADASIVRAIVSLAHSLRLKVVAEGVETSEQLKFLQSVGCDQYQGFHFSPPLPAGEFADLVRKWQRDEDAASREEAVRTHSKLARRG